MFTSNYRIKFLQYNLESFILILLAYTTVIDILFRMIIISATKISNIFTDNFFRYSKILLYYIMILTNDKTL